MNNTEDRRTELFRTFQIDITIKITAWSRIGKLRRGNIKTKDETTKTEDKNTRLKITETQTTKEE